MKDWIVPLETFQRNLEESGGVSWQGLTHGTMRTFLFGPRGRELSELQGPMSKTKSISC